MNATSQLDAIAARLSAALSGGALTLDSKSTGLDGITELLLPFSGSGALAVGSAIVRKLDERVTVLGTASTLACARASIEAVFRVEGGAPSIAITCALPGDWRIDKAFPGLVESADQPESGVTLAPPFYESLRFTNASVSVSTQDAGDKSLPPGSLRFTGQVRFEGPLQIGQLLTAAEHLAVSGYITLPRNGGARPAVSLTGRGSNEFRLGGATVGGAAISISTRAEDRSAFDSRFLASIDLKIGKDLVIGLSADLLVATAGKLSLAGDIDNLSLPSVRSIAGLVGGQDFLKGLPDALRAMPEVSLTQFFCRLDLKRKNLESLAVHLKSKGSWTVLDKLLTVSDIGLQCEFLQPLDASKTTSIIGFRGAATICGVPVVAEIDTSPLALCVRMSDGARPVPVAMLLRKLLPKGVSAPAELNVSQFAMQVTPDDKAFGMQIELDGNWTVPAVEPAFRARELGIDLIVRDAGKSMTATLHGLGEIGGIQTGFEATLDGTNWAFACALPTIPLSKLVNGLFKTASLPASIPDMSLSGGRVRLAPKHGEFAVAGELDGDWVIDAGSIKLALDNPRLDLARRAGNLSGGVYAGGSLAGKAFKLFAGFDDGATLSGSIPDLALSDLLKLFGLNKPPELPDVKIGQTTITINTAKHSMRFDGSVDVAYDFFQAGRSPTPTISVNVHIDTAKNRKPEIRIGVAATQTITFGNSVELDGFEFAFVLSATGDWTLSGSIEARFLETKLTLDAKYQKTGSGKVFSLTADVKKDLLQIPDVANLSLSWFGIEVRPADGENGQRLIAVTAKSCLEIADFIMFDGLLTASTAGLELKPAAGSGAVLRATLSLPLALPTGKAPAAEVGFSSIAIKRAGHSGGGSGSGAGQWEFSAGATITLRDVPSPADVIFGNGSAEGFLRVSASGIAVEFAPRGDPTLDIRFAAGTKLEVDLPKIGLGRIGLERHKDADSGKSTWRLTAQLGVNGLSEVNKAFGGAPVLRDSVDLTVSLGAGFAVVPNQSPFNNIELRTDEKDQTIWTQWFDFPGVGTLSFRVPEFAFDFAGGRWKATGGIVSRGELSIPLAPIRKLAELCGVGKELLDHMPDGIPLIDLDLKSPQFYVQVSRMLGTVSREVEDAFKTLASGLQAGIKHLPDNLAEYLTIHIPTDFTFEAGVEPTGGASFAVRVRDDRPIKLLLPSVVGLPPLPGLIGITFYNVAFGLTGGGNVAVLKVDGWADQFDLLNLGYALATGEGQKISNRLILRDAVALIPVMAPVPIPLFYREIGWEYRDLFGLVMQVHASFPGREPTLAQWVQLILTLIKFFSQRDYLLHETGNLPQGMDYPFTLEPTFIALPSYLGGKTLGCTAALPPLSVSDTLARALDGVKAGNLGYVIQAIPLNYEHDGIKHWIRVGSTSVSFGPLEFAAAWCITTAEEFKTKVLKDPAALQALAVANAGKMIDCTPAAHGGRSYDRGFVVLLMGEVAANTPLTRIFAFRCQFGMALLGPRDFQTAVQLSGAFGPEGVLELSVGGCIKAEPAPDGKGGIAVTVNGRVELKVFQHEFAIGSGLAVIPGELFHCDIHLELTKHVLVQGGLTVNRNGASIDASITWTGITGSRQQLKSTGTFSRNGVSFEPFEVAVGEMICTARLQLPGARKGDAFSMGVELKLPDSLFSGFKSSLADTAKAQVSRQVDEIYQEFIGAMNSKASIEVSLRGLKAWLPGLCDGIIVEIDKAITRQNIGRAMDAWAAQGSFIEKTAKKALVAAAKLFHPENTAKDSAAPWIALLTEVRRAAAAPVDDGTSYRENLQAALRKLKENNNVIVSIAKIRTAVGTFPGVQVYKRAVLSPDQIRSLDKGIEAINLLKPASEIVVKARDALAHFPKKQQVLAQINHDIAAGIESGIPVLNSVGFDASVGAVNIADLALVATFDYQNRRVTQTFRVNLGQPRQLATALAKAFADAL